jgi:hypothetical protein
MIYKFPNPNDPIRQGDIFKSLPYVVLNPEKLIVVSNNDDAEAIVNWTEISKDQPHDVVATVKSSYGIVVTQDCDTAHDPSITFFEIDEFFRVSKWNELRSKTPEELTKWWGQKFTERYRAKGQKFFYLPSDSRIGFDDKMAANYQNVFSVSSDFLKNNLVTHRAGRLNDEADEHFREHLAHYFRRYPYDEWYPYTKEEAAVYQKEIGEEIKLRDYQK